MFCALDLMLTSLFVFVGGTNFYIFVGAIISKPSIELAGWVWPFLGYTFFIFKEKCSNFKAIFWGLFLHWILVYGQKYHMSQTLR